MPKRKRKRRRKARKEEHSFTSQSISWLGDDGLHIVSPGLPPSPEELEQMTAQYQEEIRNSPLWDEMVKQFGQEEAERILKGFRAELR